MWIIQQIRYLTNHSGYSLAELLIVISIIGMLLTIAIPTYGYATNQAALLKMRADLQVIDSAISAYTAATGSLPESMSDLRLVPGGFFRNEPKPPTKALGYNLTAKKYELDRTLNCSYVQLDESTRFYSESLLPGK